MERLTDAGRFGASAGGNPAPADCHFVAAQLDVQQQHGDV